jgi:predicted Na+-dependent transporter
LIALFAFMMPQIVRSIVVIFGTFGMIAMLTLVLLSLATGWLAGGRRAEYRHTLAIGTALRNPGAAAVIAATFKTPAVEAGVAVYIIIQFVVGNVAGEVFKRAALRSARQPL